MKLKVQCIHCDKKLIATEKLFGERVKCPACGGAVDVPKPDISPLEDTAREPPETYELPKEFRNASGEGFDASYVRASRSNSARDSDSNREHEAGGIVCLGCDKRLAAGVRYCVACGHHNYDAATASDDIAADVGSRMNKIRESIENSKEMLQPSARRRLLGYIKRMLGGF